MGIYTIFWQQIVKQVIDTMQPTVAHESEVKIPELAKIGERQSSGFNGRLSTWVGSVEKTTNSAVFRSLREVIESNSQFKNKVPGYLQLRVSGNAVLKVSYTPISYDLLIERYKNISKEIKDREQKWRLIKKFQDAWINFTSGQISFTQFYDQVSFGILVYPVVLTIYAQVIRENSNGFEKLLVNLFDESKDIKQRVKKYQLGFDELYYSLHEHGKNTFQEERTIATLLAFRYPEKYPLFKDSFYVKLCKGLGMKPMAKGEKIFHYYDLVADFVKNHLEKHPEVIAEKNKQLDINSYNDQNNLILAQDILYLTLDGKEFEAEAESESNNPQITKDLAMTNSLNTILYGPPGTGKTYHTINKSVAIANPQFAMTTSTREELRAEYDRLVRDGQIEFVTFHQSMSYEDFIEGIKPVEPKEADTFLKYEIKEGIFKRLCERASKVPDAKSSDFSISDDEFQNAGFYKISLGDTSNADDDQIYRWCIKNGYIALGWGDAIDFSGKKENDIQQMVPNQLEKFAAQAVNAFVHYIKTGDYVVVTYGNLLFRAIGKVTGGYEYKNVDGLHLHQFRKVEWLVKDIELPYEEIYDRQFSQQSIYRMDKKGIKKDFFVKAGNAVPVDNKVKNYVLIIDEINRGNVSQIFGELITLIEEDKRTGKDEALTATLPYRKKTFSVPPNLYIIGTMNTADRSVEALDTALRRRFEFEEMKANPELLSTQQIIWETWWKYKMKYWDEEPYASFEKKLYHFLGIREGFGHDDVLWNKIKQQKHESQVELFNDMPVDGTGIDLKKMLLAINSRLEVLLSKDHTIGHAWLMNVFGLPDLQAAFGNKILPLLQEYFYNDYAKIGLVLGDSFVQQTKAGKSLFAKFKDENGLVGEYEDKLIYALKEVKELTIRDFQSIYQ